ncbi:MAG: hypothetical protein ABW019_03090 [Chitinophagaceae bacterium]
MKYFTNQKIHNTMKKLFIVLAVASLGFVACNNEGTADSATADSLRVADSIRTADSIAAAAAQAAKDTAHANDTLPKGDTLPK